MARPSKLYFSIETVDGAAATAEAELLWERAPKTCAAIAAMLPFETTCWHGRNSGDEALLVTPKLIADVPQDATENGTQDHTLGAVLFGFEPAGFCYGGAGSADSSEIAWIYGHAANAQYWVSAHGPPHDKPPFHRQTATLNHFAQIIKEDGFYAFSKRLTKTGERKVRVWAD